MAMSDTSEDNMTRAVIAVEKGANAGAKIVCLPELYKCRYFPQTEDDRYFDLAEPTDGESFATFSAVAKSKGVAIIVPIFEKRASGVYHNTTLVIDKKGFLVGLYRKTHIPDDPSFYEKFYFAPGDLGFICVDLGFCKIGVLVCWDQWYPEAVRLTALLGADIIFIPSAIGVLPDEKGEEAAKIRDAWITVQRGHAIANGLFIAAVNRVGVEKSEGGEGSIDFFGSSFVADPFGGIKSDAPKNCEETTIVELDLSVIERTRRVWPFFRDRRIDIYGDITKRFLEDDS